MLLLTGVSFFLSFLCLISVMELFVIVLVRHLYEKSQGGYPLCFFSLTVSHRFRILEY